MKEYLIYFTVRISQHQNIFLISNLIKKAFQYSFLFVKQNINEHCKTQHQSVII